METKINIEISLSRNFDKISLGLLDEPISYNTEEELKAEIRKKFAFLRAEVEREFKEKPQTETESTTTTPQKATAPQITFLKELGYKGSLEGLTKEEASKLIQELK